ncbi:MAG: radical SAM protein [Candidatus Heimdallarchaeota archaeon]
MIEKLKIRASIGTAAVLGLEKILSTVPPTTAYFMLYTEGHCLSNCGFCPQAYSSLSKSNSLSRVLWPVYELEQIITGLKKTSAKSLKRICIQTINFPGAKEQILALLTEFQKNKFTLPISVCSFPVDQGFLMQMKERGVTRIGIAFDCATPTIFNLVKGISRGPTLSWALLEEALEDAIDIFGNRFVSTHLIIGLGETEKEAVEFIQKFHDKGITIGLFAFTPVRGTALEHHPKPPLVSYRRIQLARFLITKNLSSIQNMSFTAEEKIQTFGVEKKKLNEVIASGKPFLTSGCPHCNRPFYNESPGKPLYNFPRAPTVAELEEIRLMLDTELKR